MSSPRVRQVIRSLVVALCALAGTWAIACAVIYSEMRRPPEEFGRFMMKIPGPVAFIAFPFEAMWTHARSGRLHLGDPAPEFALVKVDKSDSIRLSTLYRQQPVVLVFGSYT